MANLADTSLLVSIPCTDTVNLASLPEAGPDGPEMLAVYPAEAKPGTVITAVGNGLASAGAIFLADRRFDWHAEIVRQTPNAIQFRIPEYATPGVKQVLVVRRGRRTLTSQPVTVAVA